MLIKKPADTKSSEITPKGIYLNRRQFMTSASAGLITAGNVREAANETLLRLKLGRGVVDHIRSTLG